MIFKILGFAVAFLFQVYYVRILGPKDWGNLMLAMSVFAIINPIALMGLDTALTRFLPRFRGTPEFNDKLGAYLSLSFLLTTSMGLIAVCAVLLGKRKISAIISPSEDITVYIVALAPLIFLTLWGQLCCGAIRASERFNAYSFANDFLPRATRGISFSLAYAIVQYGPASFIAAVFAEGIIRLGSTVHFLGMGVKKIVFSSVALSRGEKTTFVTFGTKVVLYALLVTSTMEVVRLFLGYFGHNAGVGIYAVAETLVSILVFIQASIGTVFTPQAARLKQLHQGETMIGLYRRLSRWAFIAVLPYTLVMVLDSKEVLSLYGDAFLPGMPILMVLIIGKFLGVLLGLNGTLLYMSGYENVVLGGQIFSTSVAVVLAVLLIPRYGLIGGAAATGISALLMDLLFMASVAYIYRTTQFTLAFIRTFLAGLLLTLIVWGIIVPIDFGAVPVNIVVKLMLSYIICAGAVFLVDFRDEDRAVINMFLGKIRSVTG